MTSATVAGTHSRTDSPPQLPQPPPLHSSLTPLCVRCCVQYRHPCLRPGDDDGDSEAPPQSSSNDGLRDGWRMGIALRQEHTRGGGSSCPHTCGSTSAPRASPESSRAKTPPRTNRAPANCLHPFGVGNCEPVFFTIQKLHVTERIFVVSGHTRKWS